MTLFVPIVAELPLVSELVYHVKYYDYLKSALNMVIKLLPVLRVLAAYEEYVFDAIFTLEMLLKMYGLGLPTYFRSSFNKFDCLVSTTHF